VRIPGVQLAHLRKAALNLKVGGVGYYPSDNFVHLDTGPVRSGESGSSQELSADCVFLPLALRGPSC
jgi:hypothetical protein